MADNELAGRVAVITGAGRSIGRAMALELAAGGCAVVVNVRKNRAEAEGVVKEIEAKGGQAMAVIADVTDAPAVQAMADAALTKFGRIDYLINNAALRQEKAIDEMTYEDWRFITGVILDGAFLCVKACLPSIRQSDAGSIINIGGLTAPTWSPPRPASPA
jgi:3-oxoacyl-[acyl-carrier protein] reductase